MAGDKILYKFMALLLVRKLPEWPKLHISMLKEQSKENIGIPAYDF